MNPCEEMRAQIAFYLDDELHGSDRAAFEAHLQNCRACRQMVDRERRFLESLRGARPLYAAPPQLRARIEEILRDAPPPSVARSESRHRLGRSPRPATAFNLRQGRSVISLAITIAFIISLASVWYVTKDRNRPALNPPSDFALKAVETHLRHLRGQLPLEITSESPEAISAWFGDKVSFKLKLPNYQEISGQEKLYRLEGARLISFKNDYAAYVAYQMRTRPISLIVTSGSVGVPAGGEEIVSKGLTFHYDSIDGLKVITWSDRGLTYGLVSDLEERGQQSCLVCHAGTKDRDFIERLKPAHQVRLAPRRAS